MRITAVLRDQNIRSKRRHQLREQRIHCLAVRIVLSKWLQGDIHGVAISAPTSHFQHIASAGEEIASGFMKRDGHYTRIIVKCSLYPVTMMGIKVDIEDFSLAGLQHMRDSNGDIIIDAEARCTI